MSVSRSLRCLFANPPKPSTCIRQSFHTCTPLYARQPKHPNIKAKDLGLVTTQASARQPTKSKRGREPINLQSYSEKDWEDLAKIYTPEQLEAIKAGEESVNKSDLAKQGTIREDSFALPYFDDLAYVHPVVDKPIRAPESNYDPDLRYKEEDELLDDVVDWAQNLPNEPQRSDWTNFQEKLRLTVGKEEAERNSRSYMSPELPVIEGLPRHSDADDIEPAMRRLMKQTGYSLEEIRKFRIRVMVFHQVRNTTRMGKIESMYFLAVAGNGKGLLGIGEGKSVEIDDARTQACMAAVRNMVPIPRYEDRTIFGDVKAKVGATTVEVMSRPPGNVFLSFFLPIYFFQKKKHYRVITIIPKGMV